MGGKSGAGSGNMGGAGSGAGAPHPEALPSSPGNSLFSALMQFATPLMKGDEMAELIRRRRLARLRQEQPLQPTGISSLGGLGDPEGQSNVWGNSEIENQVMFMNSLAHPEMGD